MLQKDIPFIDLFNDLKFVDILPVWHLNSCRLLWLSFVHLDLPIFISKTTGNLFFNFVIVVNCVGEESNSHSNDGSVSFPTSKVTLAVWYFWNTFWWRVALWIHVPLIKLLIPEKFWYFLITCLLKPQNNSYASHKFTRNYVSLEFRAPKLSYMSKPCVWCIGNLN